MPVLELFSSSEKTDTLSNNEEEKELERKERIRNHIKSEIINKISSNLDDILQMIKKNRQPLLTISSFVLL